MKLEVREAEQAHERRCPFCHDELTDTEAQTSCRLCSTVSHAECATEATRCSVLGCGAALEREASATRLCARCRSDVRAGEDAWTCASCAWIHHRACAADERLCANTRCAVHEQRGSDALRERVFGSHGWLALLAFVVPIACIVGTCCVLLEGRDRDVLLAGMAVVTFYVVYFQVRRLAA